MPSERRSKRQEVMARSRALGHCICDPQKACPCDDLKLRDLCPCAGERPPVQQREVRLSEHIHNAGCASKINKRDLHAILAGLPEVDDPRVVLGRQAADDAGVVMLDDDRGTVLTVDVFTPPVDDPYTFGRIAAANSISDIYAMGAKPEVALSVVGFPIHVLPGEAMHEMLRGGIEALATVGVSVIGGHSLNDEEVKLGFAVVGSCAPRAWLDHGGAQVGDVLVLTKPIGGGLLSFANQIGRADPEHMRGLTEAMCRFNQVDGEQLTRCEAHACTDVTGFSLLGHLAEMCRKSGLHARIDFDAIPLFPGAGHLARQDVVPGGVERNRESVPEAMLDLCSLQPAQRALLFTPETSGGLLVSLTPADAERYRAALQQAGVDSAVIGSMVEAHDDGFISVQTARFADWSALPLEAMPDAASDCCSAASESCSASVPAAEVSCCDSEAPGQSCCDSGAADCCSQPEGSCCGGDANTGLPNPANAGAFATYMKAVGGAGAIDLKHTKLMALALSVSHKCGECIVANAEAARGAGASDQELGQAVDLGVAFGGASAMMFYKQVQAC